MKSSCISWPEKEPLVLIRASQVRLCDGNHCAAALLSYFEYWHNIRVEQAEQAEHHNKVAAMHGEVGMQDTSLLQYHTEQKIEDGLLHLYGRSTIRKGIALLVTKGFLSLQLNPNPRFHFDRTHYFVFHPDIVQRAIRDDSHDVKIRDGGGKSNAPSVKNTSPERKNNAAIEEITAEITDRVEERERESARAQMPDVSHITDFESRVFPVVESYCCPVNFVPDPEIRTWATQHFPDVDVDAELEVMRDWESPRPVRDWNRKLKSFIRKARSFQKPGARASPTRGVSYTEERQQREDAAVQQFREHMHGTNERHQRLHDRDEDVIDGVEYRVDE